MARLSKADVAVLRLVEDLQGLDLTDKRQAGTWVIQHCSAARRADPRILALMSGSIPVDFSRPVRKRKPAAEVKKGKKSKFKGKGKGK